MLSPTVYLHPAPRTRLPSLSVRFCCREFLTPAVIYPGTVARNGCSAVPSSHR